MVTWEVGELRDQRDGFADRTWGGPARSGCTWSRSRERARIRAVEMTPTGAAAAF
jgi:hypothetical protein